MKKNKSKLLFLCQNYFPEMVSTGLHMTELTENLVKYYSIDVFCSYPSDRVVFDKAKIKYRDLYKGVKVRRSFNFGEHNRGLISRALYGIGYVFQAFLYCLIHVRRHDLIVVTTNPPYLGVLTYLFKKVFSKKYLIIVHDIYPEVLNKLDMLNSTSPIYKLWALLNKKVFNNADRVVVLGKDAREIVKNKLAEGKADRLKVITSWSNPENVFPVNPHENPFISEHNLNNKFIVLYSGNMGRTHNIEPFLQAAKDNTDEHIQFLFVGDGKKSELVKEAIATNKYPNIKWLPLQPAKELSNVLSAANISLVCLEDQFTGYSVPSKTYGILASGRPVMALLSKESEIGDTLSNYNCGVLVPNDSKRILDLIRDAKDNPKNWETMGANGLKAFKESFTIEKVTEKYQFEIESILNE